MNWLNDYPLLKDRSHVFKEINYDKVMRMIYRFKTGIIFMGGAWCQNCQAIIGIVNQAAKKSKIRTIYHFDPRFENVFKEQVDLRDCSDLETKLNYYYLVEKLGFTGDVYVEDTLIPRMSVPSIIGIKNGVCIDIISEEYILDQKGLHYEDDDQDRSEEFFNRLLNLFQSIKSK